MPGLRSAGGSGSRSVSAGDRGLLCWVGNSQGDRCGGLGPALGLRGLDLSSILSGAPGRAGEES